MDKELKLEQMNSEFLQALQDQDKASERFWKAANRLNEMEHYRQATERVSMLRKSYLTFKHRPEQPEHPQGNE